MAGPTADQWRDALEKAYSDRDSAEGVTTEEMADALDCSKPYARRRLKTLIKRGEWEHKGRAHRVKIDGVACMKPVYGPVE